MWTIVRNLLDDDKSLPRYDPTFRGDSDTVFFTLSDDDNIPYYQGYVLDRDDALYDLWSWGAYYAGTTLLYIDGELCIG